MSINYQIKIAITADILKHFKMCNKNFISLLETRINLKDFAGKIFYKTITFEAWNNNNLIGLLSCYFNDNTKFLGFINHVSVCKEFQGKGISRNLLKMCIQYGIKNGFKKISLEVAVDNYVAISLYKKNGFIKLGSNNGFMVMELFLGEIV